MTIPAPPALPESEINIRLGRTRDAMRAAGISLLVGYADCWRTANVRYFTDFRPVDGVHAIAQAVILIPLDSDPILLAGDGCVDYARSTTAFDVDSLDFLVPRLSAVAGDTSGTIALAGEEHLPVRLHREMTEALGARGLTSTNLLAKVKAVKSDWELEQLRVAAGLTDLAMEAVRDVVSSGRSVTEREIARAADVAMIRAGADTPAYLSMVQSGPRSAYSLALPTNRVLQPGEMVMTDIGARYGNYVADGGRGFVFGHPSDAARAIVETAADAVEAGLEAARPGMRASELNSVIQSVLVQRGYAEYSGEAMGRGTGHGTGMDPEEELPWIGPTDHDVLQPGSVFTLKATITVPEVGGLRTERIVHMGADGIETLDFFPMRNYW